MNRLPMILSLLLCLALAGCDDDPSTGSDTDAGPSMMAAADAGPGMARAVSAWRRDLALSSAGDLKPREVVALLKQGAERDPKARAYLGVMYGIGLGVALDTKKATKHLTTAEQAGERDAAVYLKNLSANWN